MTGDCETLELPEGLDKIKATLASAESGVSLVYKIRENGVDSLKETYGELDADNMTVWRFDDANPLVGLYGRQTEAGIAQLGFITLDTACQAAAEDVVEPVEPVEPVAPGEPTGREGTEEKDSAGVLGLPLSTALLIAAGAVVGVGLAVAALCTLRYRKNQHNRVASPVTGITRKSGRAPKELRPVVADTDIENNATPAVYSSATSHKGGKIAPEATKDSVIGF